MIMISHAATLLKRLWTQALKTDKQNQKRVTKVTEFELFGIELYLSPIVDWYNDEMILTI